MKYSKYRRNKWFGYGSGSGITNDTSKMENITNIGIIIGISSSGAGNGTTGSVEYR